jgi:hypothetical protein
MEEPHIIDKIMKNIQDAVNFKSFDTKANQHDWVIAAWMMGWQPERQVNGEVVSAPSICRIIEDYAKELTENTKAIQAEEDARLCFTVPACGAPIHCGCREKIAKEIRWQGKTGGTGTTIATEEELRNA